MPTETQTNPNAEAESIETISFVSLGCPKNLVDSEKMLGLLAADGLMPVSAEVLEDQQVDDLSVSGSEQDSTATSGRVTPADAVVINTCAVTAEAVRKADPGRR